MTWFYQDKEFIDPQDNWGFIYEITNLDSGKKYIGKKQFYFKKYKRVKGKRKSYLVESDWQTYYGSSNYLQEDVKELGNEKFKRVILKLCKSKSECSFWEAKFQFDNDVLLKPDEYYNEWIMVRVRRSNLIKNKK